MTIRQISLPATLIVVALGFCVAHAQQSVSTGEKARTTAELQREKAFSLLESLAGQVATLQSAENRARLGSNIAESLWDHDEKRARSLFVSVEYDIKTGFASALGDDPFDEKTRMVFFHLRVDTARRIANHDPESAVTFLKATELPLEAPRSYAFAEMERNLDIQLAREVAANSPDLALKIGRQHLARGFSYDLVGLLSKLRRKHPEQAMVLYQEIVSKLRQVDLAKDPTALYFAVDLARSFTPPALDESSYRELINIFITTALANGCADKINYERESRRFCSWIGPLVSQMEKFDPARAARLRQWMPESPETRWSPEGWRELTEVSEEGTVDEILALVSKYPEMERQIYWQAMMKAQAEGDFERARKIATDYRGDPEMRKSLLAQAESQQKMALMNDEKLAEIQNRLGAIPRARDQVSLLLAFASRLGAGDRKTALKLLNQANDIVNSMKPGKEQTEAQIILAAMHCLQESDQGLAMMESLLPRLNQLVAAAVQLDGFENHYLREGEWNMSSEGAVGNLLTDLAQNAGYFAWCDFDRAVNVAGQLERPELRLMAQLKLAQAILAGPPKRFFSTVRF